MTITVSGIHIYPIKSTKGISLQKSELQKIGLVQDRRRAVVVTSSNKILTARECQLLFGLSTQITEHAIWVHSPTSSLHLPLIPDNKEISRVKLWADEAHPGIRYSKEVDQWFSEQLNMDCFLIFMGEDCRREFPTGMASGYTG